MRLLQSGSMQYAETNRHLIYFLIVAFVIQAIVSSAVAYVSVRLIQRQQRELMERFESLREDTLRSFIEQQREENRRLVADTRAATAKMNVMADALWQGLQYPKDGDG